MTFNGAHHFSMQSAAFTNIFHNHHQTGSPAGILRHAQAVEALHTSATVGYISKCHPGTREKVTEDTVDWVVGAPGANQGSAPQKSILWFSGPAGGGKTSIMRGVVDRCVSRGFSTLSFFFSVRGSGVTSLRPFVATIVHQLVALDPVLKLIVYDAIRDRPTIFEESLEFQMERLLVIATTRAALQLQSPPQKIIIAIDGLDECHEEQEREQLLNLLHSLIPQLPRRIVVIIASRPEFDLRRAFSRPNLNEITERIKLHEYDGSDDIRAFVCNELQEIRQSHPLAGLIPEGWVLEEIVQLLVDKSSGNFIVPATAMKYIKHSRRSPVDSLNIIVGVLKNPLPTSKPFADLDALYTHILHPPDTDLSLIRRILHITITITDAGQGDFLCPSFLDDLLGLPPGTTATTLCDLHSILHIPESEDEPIKFHHKSLKDYLLDRERSLDFFQSPYEIHLDLATCCATHLTRWGCNPVLNDSSSIFYSAHFWPDHLDVCIDKKPAPATLPKAITDLDPRNSAIHFFIYGYRPDDFWVEEAKPFHVALCSQQHCGRLCRLLTRVANCVDKCEAFRKTFHQDDIKGRFNVLSRFKSETGLFAPLDPDSCVVFGEQDEEDEDKDKGDEDDGDEDGGEVDEGEDIQPEAGPSTLPPPPSINLEADTRGGPAGGSGGSTRLSAKMASLMEVHDIATVSKKRPHDGAEDNPKKKRKKGNRD